MIATVGLYFDGRMSKEDEYYVKYAIYFAGKQKYYTTGLKLDKKYVDFLKKYKAGLTGGVKDPYLRNLWHMYYGSTYIHEKSGNEEVSIVRRAEEIIAKLGHRFTFEDFAATINRKDEIVVNTTTDNIIADLQIKSAQLEKDSQLSSAELYDLAAKSLIRFNRDSSSLRYEDVDKDFLKSYEVWMLKEGKLSQNKKKSNSPASITTVGIYARCIRSIFNEMINAKLVDADLYPFGKRGYTIPKSNNIKKALSKEDIGKILNLKLTPESIKEQSRDLWLFSYLSNGLNFADILNLKWKDLDKKNDTIIFVRQKTADSKKSNITKIQVDLNPISLAILNRWGIGKGEYIFPFFEKGMTLKRKREVKAQVVKNTNKYMKQISEELEINIDVKTYAARHSFATILLQSEAPLAFISQKLGHSSISTTQSYLGSFEDKQVKKYLNALIPDKEEDKDRKRENNKEQEG